MAKFVCKESECNQEFNSSTALRDHRINHHGPGFICNEPGCNQKFNNSRGLSNHKIKEHGSGFICKDCNQKFNSRTPLREHKIKEHGSGFICKEPGCNQKFNNDFALRQHKIKEHGSGFICKEPGCNQKFDNDFAFRQHKIKDHGHGHGFICKEPGCNQKFNNYNALREHKIKDHGSGFICEDCNQKFNNRTTLRNHKTNDHGFGSDKEDINLELILPPVSHKYLKGLDPVQEVFVEKIGENDLSKLSAYYYETTQFLFNQQSIKYQDINQNIQVCEFAFQYNFEIKDNTQIIFVCAGRISQNSSFVPSRSTKTIIVPVIHLSERNNISGTTLSYQITGDYSKEKNITTRRAAILHFAKHFKLNDFIMMDDNIKSIVHFNTVISSSTERNCDWDGLYDFLRKECKEIGSFISGMNNIYGINLRFPSKIHFINSKEIFEILDSSFKGEVKHLLPNLNNQEVHFPLEDYYMLFSIMFLYKCKYKSDNTKSIMDSIGILNQETIGYERSMLTTNNSKKESLINLTTANDWLLVDTDGSTDLRKFVINTLKTTVTKAIETKRQYYEDYRKIFVLDFYKKNSLKFDSQKNKSNVYDNVTSKIFKEFRVPQAEAADIINKSDKQIINIKMPTGTGKTKVILYSALSLLQSRSIFIIAPTIDIVNQIFDSFKKDLMEYKDINIPFLKIMSGEKAICEKMLDRNHLYNHRFGYIFCYDSFKIFLARNKNVYPDTPRIFDESHIYFKPNKEHEGLLSTKNILFSATPYSFGPYDYSLSTKKATDEFKLIPNVTKIQKDFNGDNAIFKNICNILREEHGKGLIFLSGIKNIKDYAKKLQDYFTNHLLDDRKIIEVHSKVARNTYSEIIRNNSKLIILADKMLQLGTDIPNLDFIINTKEETNYRATQQIIGRLKRGDPDSEKKYYHGKHNFKKNKSFIKYDDEINLDMESEFHTAVNDNMEEENENSNYINNYEIDEESISQERKSITQTFEEE
ncbi:DEAD/DEAH box helicase family protein [Allofrancisella frigidaquae]|uniref:DEAD/DEAH box helicase n=1 Tax=Allofrancisella frigidaquae TaxID=1085644 RepID=A0A6M3HWW5_9GAMM|nr:DEAD/DEAH box helicase family protein [Allofrancisella frigidaquae]QIV94571.1 DEAD/DEAH box helicase [Allofrancisella frigidaquae]